MTSRSAVVRAGKAIACAVFGNDASPVALSGLYSEIRAGPAALAALSALATLATFAALDTFTGFAATLGRTTFCFAGLAVSMVAGALALSAAKARARNDAEARARNDAEARARNDAEAREHSEALARGLSLVRPRDFRPPAAYAYENARYRGG